tara:strand:+ start:451 stop:747 length:297 start_codon:yes stop_codon:yes gene_type:complete
MVTITSKIAYSQLNKDGVAKSQKARILDVVNEKDNGKGLSLREIKKETNIDINAVSGRVNDLKKMNFLETAEKRKCTISGKLINPVMVTKLYLNFKSN